MSKRRHNFGTKRFKEKSLFIFHARIALKSLILLFVRLIARGARIGKTHTHTHTDRQTDTQDKYCNPRACAPRVNETTPELLEVSKRRHNFGTERFKEKSLFIFHARIALKSLILLFVRLIARGARIGKTHTHTDRQTERAL